MQEEQELPILVEEGGGAVWTSAPAQTGGNGGSGVVVVKEPAVPNLINTGGVWSLDAVYEAVKGGNWTKCLD